MVYVVIPHTLFVILALTVRYMPLKNAIVYSTFPYLYMGVGYIIDLLKIKDKLINFISKSGAIMGKYSYSLYISHYTILFIFSRLIHNVLLYALASLPIILLIAYGLESWLQPAVMSYFRKNKQPDTEVKPQATTTVKQQEIQLLPHQATSVRLTGS